jgi:hypothetical protein
MLDENERQGLIELLADARLASCVVILPERRLPNGIGVYDEGVVELYKELMADGIEVTWADIPERRSLEGERSSIADGTLSAIIGFPWGVLSNATWDWLKLWFSRAPRATQEIQVELARATSPDGSTWDWASFGGNGPTVVDAMDVYMQHLNDGGG